MDITWTLLTRNAALTRIDGIDVTTALALISEAGADMSRFPSDKHFASWMGLCPGTKITGGKVMSGATKRCANRATQALRLAAAALRTSQSALGAYYRRICSRMDKTGDGCCAQAGAADLQHADQGRGIHRSRSGLLRRALPAARAAQPQQTGAAVGHDAGADRASSAGGLKNSLCVSHLRGVS